MLESQDRWPGTDVSRVIDHAHDELSSAVRCEDVLKFGCGVGLLILRVHTCNDPRVRGRRLRKENRLTLCPVGDGQDGLDCELLDRRHVARDVDPCRIERWDLNARKRERGIATESLVGHVDRRQIANGIVRPAVEHPGRSGSPRGFSYQKRVGSDVPGAHESRPLNVRAQSVNRGPKCRFRSGRAHLFVERACGLTRERDDSHGHDEPGRQREREFEESKAMMSRASSHGVTGIPCPGTTCDGFSMTHVVA